MVCNYRIHENQISSIQKYEIACLYSWFEQKTFYEYFLNIDNIDLAKKIWPNSRFTDKLNYKEDIPFFVAHNMFLSRLFADVSSTYIQHLFEDKNATNRLESIFNYSVK